MRLLVRKLSREGTIPTLQNECQAVYIEALRTEKTKERRKTEKHGPLYEAWHTQEKAMHNPTHHNVRWYLTDLRGCTETQAHTKQCLFMFVYVGKWRVRGGWLA